MNLRSQFTTLSATVIKGYPLLYIKVFMKPCIHFSFALKTTLRDKICIKAETSLLSASVVTISLPFAPRRGESHVIGASVRWSSFQCCDTSWSPHLQRVKYHYCSSFTLPGILALLLYQDPILVSLHSSGESFFLLLFAFSQEV